MRLLKDASCRRGVSTSAASCHGMPRAARRASCAASCRVRRSLACAAAKDTKRPPTPSQQEVYIEALKKGGCDQKTAAGILKRWQDAGWREDVSSEANLALLRRLFIQTSLAPVAGFAVQLLFDGGAAYSIFLTAGFISLGPDFFGRFILVFGLDALALYFASCAFFDSITLGSALLTAYRLGTSPLVFVEAVKAVAGQAAGPGDGLDLVGKAKAAASALKVAQALDAIAGLLDRAAAAAAAGSGGAPPAEARGGATASIDTLTNLSAYLVLYRAESEAGFHPADVGMGEAEAASIALVFGRYDANEDGRLDAREFSALLDSLGAGVDGAEAEAAMEVMDGDKDGAVDFPEFARWWAERKQNNKP